MGAPAASGPARRRGASAPSRPRAAPAAPRAIPAGFRSCDRSSSFLPGLHRWGESGNRRGREDAPEPESEDRHRDRHVDRGLGGQQLLGEDDGRDDRHPDEAHDAQRHQHQHEPDARADAAQAEPESGADALEAALAEAPLEQRELVAPSREHDRAGRERPVRPVRRVYRQADEGPDGEVAGQEQRHRARPVAGANVSEHRRRRARQHPRRHHRHPRSAEEPERAELGTFGFFAAAWVSMMAAMMLPGAAPAVLRHVRAGDRARAVPLFLAGYLAVWALVGLPVYAAYRPHGSLAAGAVVLAAGCYELTLLKRRFRQRCLQSIRSGLGFGLCCVGSSIGLMLMLVALGVMSLVWMSIIAAVVLAQKLLPAKAAIDVPVAVAILGLGIWIILASASVPGLTPSM